MDISAAQVKELRERTGLGMMECKNALVECDGDMDKAIELLRKRAGAKIEKKAGRTAAEGRVVTHISDDRRLAAMVEVNCETDFVAKEDSFVRFAEGIASCVVKHHPTDLEGLMSLPLKDGKPGSVAQARENLVAKLGENISIRRFVRYEAAAEGLDSYVHGGRIGVLVDVESSDQALAHDIAMHIAASRPEYVSRDDVPPNVVAKEKEILMEQARDSGKPPEIIEKMVTGRLNKYLNEMTLLGQPFVKDLDTTVDKLLKSAGAKVRRFCRYELGEGIEKRSADFAAEVMAQVKGG